MFLSRLFNFIAIIWILRGFFNGENTTKQSEHPQLKPARSTSSLSSSASASTNPLLRNRCNICNKPPTLRCTICESILYCSRPCQKADWPVHKLLCSSYKSFQSPPSDDSYRALYFAENAATPQFVWLTAKIDDKEDGEWVPNVKKYVQPSMSFLLREENKVRNRRFDAIEYWFRDAFTLDGSKENRGVARLVGGKEKLGYDWRGPVLVLKKKPKESRGYTFTGLQHFGMGDLRDVADFFITHRGYE